MLIKFADGTFFNGFKVRPSGSFVADIGKMYVDCSRRFALIIHPSDIDQCKADLISNGYLHFTVINV